MNILFFINHYPDSRNGGVENVTKMLSEYFVNNGHSVHIRYLLDSKFANSDNSLFDSCERIDKSTLSFSIYNAVKQHNIDIIINRNTIFASPIIRNAVKGLNCHLITTYNNKPTIAPPTIKDVFDNPFISKINKAIIFLTYPIFALRSRIKLKRKHQNSYRTSEYTILLSKYYIDEYSKMMGIDSNKLVCLNNPIRDNLKLNDKDILNKEKTVLMVTRLDEQQKCIIKALKIWEKISKDNSDWKLQIVGSGPDEKKIKGYAKNQNIKNIEFIPAQNPEEFYRKASIFLMTSRNEGWPNTLNEAMRLACVPIAIDTFSAIYDIIDNNENGIIVRHTSQEKDIENCVLAISTLIKDKDLLNKIAVNACKKTERLSAEVIAKQWIKLFEEALSKH